MLILTILLMVVLLAFRLSFNSGPPRSRKKPANSSATPTGHFFSKPKAAWVRREVFRLKALMPMNGCRKIAMSFNHLHRGKESVSKSYVANQIAKHQKEIMRLRRGIKHRIPRPLPRNIIWALDLAVVPKRKEPILAILDHGTRACLALKTLPDKSALAVLVILIPLMRRLGKPRYLRTDNDGTFRSLFFRAVLKLVGVKHRPIAPFCPWQNGRVERFILTMKERLLPWLREVGLSENHFQGDLDLLRFWYNHARPHQHLSGRVPKELWHGGEVSSAKLRFFSEWGGLLAGYYRPPP